MWWNEHRSWTTHKIEHFYFKCAISTSQMDTLLLQFEKLSTGKLNILSISQIIFHKVRGPVTCWEVVVHHLRPVYSMMDGMLLQTHWGTSYLCLEFFFWDTSCWDSSIKKNRTAIWMQGLHCLWENAAVLSPECLNGGKWWGLLKKRLYHSLFSVVIFCGDLLMGGWGTEGLNVISWGLRLDPKKSNVPAQHNSKENRPGLRSCNIWCVSLVKGFYRWKRYLDFVFISVLKHSTETFTFID